MREEAIDWEYYCEYCERCFWDEDEAEGHEADCDRNPAVIEERRADAERQQRKVMGLYVEEELPLVPKTLKMSPDTLAGNARLE